MKFRDKTILQITETDKKGRGCGLVNGRRACAYFTAPGEEIEASLLARKQGNLIFQLEKVLTASSHRVAAPCPNAGKCGGCLWQQFDYPFQLELKKSLLEKSLAPVGLGGRLQTVVPCPALTGFRNRMDYCVGPNGELGLKEPGRWNSHLDVENCLLLSPQAVKVMAVFRAWMKKNKVAPWDNRRYVGYARYLVIREGKNTGERMLVIVTAEGELPAKEELLAELAGLATTVYHGINPTVTDLSIVSQMELLRGEPRLREKIGGLTYLIPPNSFFQTNTLMAERLLLTVRRFLAPRRSRTLLDLYCGVGFFGLGLADTADRVLGVELDEAAVATAKENAVINNISHAEFLAAKAESLSWDQERPDTVIVDPPRSGLHPKVLETLLARRPERLVYVSCNHESFAHDWRALTAVYDVTDLEALDLFPHSPHVELVTLLELK